MKLSEAGAETVWLPLTPPRVAALPFAPFRRILAVQLIFAAAAGLAVASLLASSWFPVIRQAIAALPETGEFRGATLDWRGSSPIPLAGNAWLALSVDLEHSGLHRFPADLHVEFGRYDARCFSLAGYVDVPYPRGYTVAFNRSVLDPWWSAREPFLVAVGGAVVLGVLPLFWSGLGVVYALAGRWVFRFISSGLSFPQAWKLCVASQMPGGLAAAAGTFLYGLGAIDLVTFLFIVAAQIAAAWVYLFLALFFLPAKAPGPRGSKSNPFKEAR